MANKLISATVLPRMLEIALHGHLDAQSLFDEAAIDADAVGHPDRYVTMEQLDTLLTRAYGEAVDPLFGLHVGMQHNYGALDLLGRLMASSDTLGHAFSMLLRYKDLLSPHLTFTLEPHGANYAFCVWPDRDLQFVHMRVHGELLVTTMQAVIGSLLGKRLPLEQACFPYPALPRSQIREYQDFFQCQMVFDAPCGTLVFDKAWLQAPLPGVYPKYRARLEQTAIQTLRSLNEAGSLSNRVMLRLMEQLGEGPLTIERIAEDMNMTTRTLQRHLREENTRFGHLRDRVRMDYACRKLSSQHCDTVTLASDLGFSDTANFYHAFKRWKGCAPGEYRRQALSQL